MGFLLVEFVKRHCFLALKIEEPLQTLQRLMDFFADRKINIESLHMHSMEGGEAKIHIYCLIEKDRINHNRQAMEKMRGVLELRLMENKEPSNLKITSK
jgi:acetolactate synthase small subunit